MKKLKYQYHAYLTSTTCLYTNLCSSLSCHADEGMRSVKGAVIDEREVTELTRVEYEKGRRGNGEGE
jgi:hypothetical protein